MKKLLLFFVASLLIFSSCGNSDQSNNNETKQFNVTINLDNAEGETAILYKATVFGDPLQIDEIALEGDEAVMEVEGDDPLDVYYLVFEESGQNLVLFPENQDVTITGDLENPLYIEATGCSAQNIYNDLHKDIIPYIEQMISLENESMEAYYTDLEKYKEITAKMNALFDEYHECHFNFIKNHPDSFVAHFILDGMKYDIEFDKLKEMADVLTNETVFSKSIKDLIEHNEHAEVGQPFTDFTLKTVDGNEVNLETTIKENKITMIDFWASWCQPCRNENPVVKAAYEKYHDKGFEIIGISVDKKEDSWLKAVEDDALPYIQTRDEDGTVADKYAIVYIPSNFLFDQNGTIIAKNLRGEELEAKLAELLQTAR